MRRTLALLLCAAVFALAAGCGNKGPLYPPIKETPLPHAPVPVQGNVTNLDEFNAFIAMHPTPKQFHEAYPDVKLVMPGYTATREFRTDNSRYFPQMDDTGHIIGGHFM